MTDTILHALGGLLQPESLFLSELQAEGPTRTAIARALEAVMPPVEVAIDGAGASEHLAALLRARLQAGALAGDIPANLPVEDLAVFFSGIVLGLLAAALGKGSPRNLQMIRQVALSVWTDQPAKASINEAGCA